MAVSHATRYTSTSPDERTAEEGDARTQNATRTTDERRFSRHRTTGERHLTKRQGVKDRTGTTRSPKRAERIRNTARLTKRILERTALAGEAGALTENARTEELEVEHQRLQDEGAGGSSRALRLARFLLHRRLRHWFLATAVSLWLFLLPLTVLTAMTVFAVEQDVTVGVFGYDLFSFSVSDIPLLGDVAQGIWKAAHGVVVIVSLAIFLAYALAYYLILGINVIDVDHELQLVVTALCVVLAIAPFINIFPVIPFWIISISYLGFVLRLR